MEVYLLSGKLYSRNLCCSIYWQIWNPKLDDVAIDVQKEENSHDSHEDTMHAVVMGTFNSRAFLLLIVGGAIKAEITEPRQRSDLPHGGLKVLCWLLSTINIANFLVLTGTFAVQSSRSNVVSHSNLASYYANFFATNFLFVRDSRKIIIFWVTHI